jgi:hypothetical protein
LDLSVIDGCVCVAWIDGGWDVGSRWESWWLVGCISFFAGKEISLFEIIQMSTNDKHKRQTQQHNRQTKDITQTTNNTIPIWYSTYFANTFIHQSAIKILECKYKKWVQD